MRWVRLLPLRRLDGAWWATLAVALAFLAFCVAGGLALGTGWDEDEHRRYGRIALDFYRSFGANQKAVGDEMGYYGALHALLGAAAEALLPSLHWAFARHLATNLFALVGLLYAARLARLLAGPWAGFVAALLVAATPRWTGDAMSNPIDVPTAAMFTAALYYLARLIGDFERARLRDWLCFGIAVGLTLAVRLIGVLLLPYAALALAGWLVLQPGARLAVLRAHGRRLVLGFALATLVAGLVAAAFWPRFLVGPISALRIGFDQTQGHPWYGSVFFQGAYHGSREIPREYLPVWLWITTPLVTMFALLLAVLFQRRWLNERGARLRAATLVFALLFPPLWAIATRAVIYDGVRHFLFLLPPLGALGAAGVVSAWRALAPRRWAVAPLGAVLLALVAEPLAWYARSFPYAYTYFNPLAGGLARASHAYDTDYWGLSFRAAAELLAKHRLDLVGKDDVLVIQGNVNWHLLAPWVDDPTKYAYAEPNGPYHVLLFWYRGRPLGWERQGQPLFHGVAIEDQVPFWQAYAGPLAIEAWKRGRH
jgi:4-amino-4-deoxy-L-arabinose transferase-like glycosyltransferase